MENSFFYNFVSSEYGCEYNCEEFGCIDEGICRCSIIINPRVKSVDVVRLSNHVYSKLTGKGTINGVRNEKLSTLLYGGSLVDVYCINRVLTSMKIWKNDNWRFIIHNSYYGEEVNDIKMSDNTFKRLNDLVSEVLSINNITDKIKFLLNLEYGSLLDDIKLSEFELITVNKSDVEYSNKNNLNLISKKNLNHYVKYDIPRGVVRRVGDKYSIIDGQHRIYLAPETFQVFCLK